jgi:hypothetical protein
LARRVYQAARPAYRRTGRHRSANAPNESRRQLRRTCIVSSHGSAVYRRAAVQRRTPRCWNPHSTANA